MKALTRVFRVLSKVHTAILVGIAFSEASLRGADVKPPSSKFTVTGTVVGADGTSRTSPTDRTVGVYEGTADWFRFKTKAKGTTHLAIHNPVSNIESSGRFTIEFERDLFQGATSLLVRLSFPSRMMIPVEANGIDIWSSADALYSRTTGLKAEFQLRRDSAKVELGELIFTNPSPAELSSLDPRSFLRVGGRSAQREALIPLLVDDAKEDTSTDAPVIDSTKKKDDQRESQEENIRAAGIHKAKELGYKPVIITLNENGTMDLMQGSEFTLNNGKFVLVNDNLVVNAHAAPREILGTTLNQGEYGLVKDGKCVKLPGTLNSASPNASDLRAKVPVSSPTKNSRTTADESTFAKPPKNWPVFKENLSGRLEVRVRNPNDFKVRVGLRSDGKGKDFVVAANDAESVRVPQGRYDVYFQYSNEPDGLFQGDSFGLNNNGVEIQIVKVVDGNFGIRRIK